MATFIPPCYNNSLGFIFIPFLACYSDELQIQFVWLSIDIVLYLQLLNECKEVISTAIIGKFYYRDMTLSVVTADDKARIEAIDDDITEFEDDIKSLLSVSFKCFTFYRNHLDVV